MNTKTMSTRGDFLVKRDVLIAIPDSEVDSIKRMPISTYIHEAEALYRWCRDDRAALEIITGVWELAEDIPIRAGALRELESMWRKERCTPSEAGRRWKDESPALFEMRKGLLQAFRYAFRDDKALLRRVRDIAKGNTNAERLQNLNDLAVLGRDNQELLTEIAFDLTQLDEAAAKSAEMSEVLAAATSGRKKGSETLKLRDKAYTHLKKAVDETYCAGRYLLRHHSDRLKGYSSEYLNKRRSKPPPFAAPRIEAPGGPPEASVGFNPGEAEGFRGYQTVSLTSPFPVGLKGKCTIKVLPVPSLLSTSMRPP